MKRTSACNVGLEAAQFPAKRAENTNIIFSVGSKKEVANAMAATCKVELGPLGLKLRKTPSLIDLVQANLSAQTHQQQQQQAPSCSNAMPHDKRKAANFPASLLRIGQWEYSSKYQCDLVVKSYFAKRKLVWEILQGGLKSKIEIQWCDISGLRAMFPENKPSLLEIELLRPPVFFRESNPQPRKHTIWQATSDFTGGQATVFRKHLLQFPYGIFERHYQNLLESDNRLRALSSKPLGHDREAARSPYFSSQFLPFTIHRQQQYYFSLMKDVEKLQAQLQMSKTLPNDASVSPLREASQYGSMNNEFKDKASCCSDTTSNSNDGAMVLPDQTQLLNEISDYLLRDQEDSSLDSQLQESQYYHEQLTNWTG